MPVPAQATKTLAPAAPQGMLQRTPALAGGARKCACGGTPGPSGECEECRKKRLGTLQRSPGGQAPAGLAPPIVHDVLRSPGQPLEAGSRGLMESRFGHDFSRVRVHADAQAADSARAVNAHAYTVGKSIVFGAGRYALETDAGRRLLAHELTHVLQQGEGVSSAPGKLAIGQSDTPEERAAERAAELGSEGARPRPGAAWMGSWLVQRQEAGPEGSPEPAAEKVEPGKAPGSEHVFASPDGVKVVVFRKCGTSEFGFAKIEKAANEAFAKVFQTECVSADRRAVLQKNLKQFGLRIWCRQPSEMELGPERCAESSADGNIKLSSRAFNQKDSQNADCGNGNLAIVILHELMHASLGATGETLPRSCENSCFQNDRGVAAEVCKNPRQPGTRD